MITTPIAGVLGVMMAWQSLDLPRPAWKAEVDELRVQVAELKQFNYGTRALVLNQKWERLFRQVAMLEAQDRRGQLTQDQQELLTNLKLQMRLVGNQLRQLEENHER